MRNMKKPQLAPGPFHRIKRGYIRRWHDPKLFRLDLACLTHTSGQGVCPMALMRSLVLHFLGTVRSSALWLRGAGWLLPRFASVAGLHQLVCPWRVRNGRVFGSGIEAKL